MVTESTHLEEKVRLYHPEDLKVVGKGMLLVLNFSQDLYLDGSVDPPMLSAYKKLSIPPKFNGVSGILMDFRITDGGSPKDYVLLQIYPAGLIISRLGSKIDSYEGLLKVPFGEITNFSIWNQFKLY